LRKEGTAERWESRAQATAPGEWWAVASQDCDIAAKAEPHVELVRAFWTTDKGAIRMARLNSARRYLLARRSRAGHPEEGLIADATVRLLVEKSSLLEVRPAQDVVDLDREAKRRFGEWLARRYHRPAVPDSLVHAIQKPLVESLRALKQDDPLCRLLEALDEVRFSVLEDSPPFHVSLVCITAQDSAWSPLDEAEIRGWFAEVLDGKEQTRLKAVEFRSPASISLADYLALRRLALDEFSLEEG
jgi:hypothetical protein